MTRVRLGIIIMLVTLGALWYSRALVWTTPASSIPNAEFIAAALRHQEQAIPSLDVTYLHRNVSVTFPELTFRYVRTPDVLYMEMGKDKGVRQSEDRASNEFRSLEKYRSGEILGVVDDETGGPLCTDAIMETARYTLGDGPLCDVIRRGTVATAMEEIDGHQCWRVSIQATALGFSKYSVWVDPDIGFCPRKIDTTLPDNTTYTKTFTDYKQVEDEVWFPMRIDMVTPVADPELKDELTGGTGIMHTQTVVQSIDVSKNFAKSDLIVEFPKGTKVRDGIRNAEYIIP